MTDKSQTTIHVPCREGHERCAVPDVECECERVIYEQQAQFLRNGPSPTVCRAMSSFWARLGDTEAAQRWHEASLLPRSEGNG